MTVIIPQQSLVPWAAVKTGYCKNQQKSSIELLTCVAYTNMYKSTKQHGRQQT